MEPDYHASRCAHHPTTPAEWFCPDCMAALCDHCVWFYPSATTRTANCRHCGARCALLGADPAEPAPASPAGRSEPMNLMLELPRLVQYPLRGGAWIQTALCALAIEIAWQGVQYNIVGLFAAVILVGYLLAMLRKIIEESAAGEDRLSDWPDLTNWVDDVLLPLLRIGTVILACFGPAWAWHAFRGKHDVIYVALMILGLIYYPMAALAVTLFDSVKALAPSVIFPAIGKIRDEYAALCLLLVILEVVREGIAGWLGGTIVGLAVSFANAYALFLHGHMIGLLYRIGGARLGWFDLLRPTPATPAAQPGPAPPPEP